MKRFVILALLVSFASAKTTSDVALTWGHNNFNEDDATLYDTAAYYGLRAGFYTDENFSFQVGYEQTNSANCQGLKLKRFYTNAIIQTEIQGGLKPYLVGTLGYETSSKAYRDSQPFLGIGAGLKYALANHITLFIETRALRNLTSKDTTFSTTAGIGYLFDTAYDESTVVEKTSLAEVKKSPKIRLRPVMEEVQKPVERVSPKSVVSVHHDSSIKHITVAQKSFQEGYYVQVEALTTSSPNPILRKLRAKGVTKSGIKKMRGYTFVVVGPYHDRATASQALGRLKSISPHAFIKKF